MGTDLKPLLTILAVMILIVGHVFLTTYIALLPFLVWNWLLLAASVSPYVIVYCLQQRKENAIRAKINNAQPREWNIDRTLEDYRKLIEKT